MPRARARAGKLTAWQAVLAVERSWREKEAFIDAAIEAARVDEEEVEKVRQAYASGRISYEEAMRRFREIAERGKGAGRR